MELSVSATGFREYLQSRPTLVNTLEAKGVTVDALCEQLDNILSEALNNTNVCGYDCDFVDNLDRYNGTLAERVGGMEIVELYSSVLLNLECLVILGYKRPRGSDIFLMHVYSRCPELVEAIYEHGLGRYDALISNVDYICQGALLDFSYIGPLDYEDAQSIDAIDGTTIFYGRYFLDAIDKMVSLVGNQRPDLSQSEIDGLVKCMVSDTTLTAFYGSEQRVEELIRNIFVVSGN